MGSGGTEKIILQLARIYQEAGHEVIVCSAYGKGVERLNSENIRFVEIPDISDKSLKTFLRVYRIITGLMEKEHFDIVHTHHRMAAFYTRLLKNKYSFIFLNNIHNTFNDKFFLTRYAFERAHNIAVGEAVKRNMISDYKLSHSKIEIIYNAIDNNEIRLKKVDVIEELRGKGKFIVTNIGRINTQKGFEYYIDAANIIREKDISMIFLIVGDGIKYDEIKEKVRINGLDNDIIFLGYRKDVLDIIYNSDLIVLSSLWEGFPLTPIEAFSCGKTIVATEVSGTSEIVKDNCNGLIVPVKDGNAIASAIIELYYNKDLKRKLEKGASLTYQKKFSYQRFKESYISLIEGEGNE